VFQLNKQSLIRFNKIKISYFIVEILFTIINKQT